MRAVFLPPTPRPTSEGEDTPWDSKDAGTGMSNRMPRGGSGRHCTHPFAPASLAARYLCSHHDALRLLHALLFLFPRQLVRCRPSATGQPRSLAPPSCCIHVDADVYACARHLGVRQGAAAGKRLPRRAHHRRANTSQSLCCIFRSLLFPTSLDSGAGYTQALPGVMLLSPGVMFLVSWRDVLVSWCDALAFSRGYMLAFAGPPLGLRWCTLMLMLTPSSAHPPPEEPAASC